ncbi:MAG TPA: hypothetical protein VFT62_08030 [Mycobacteriales bacterium]|nr:hypothetical protein [Mycobacteriales bacterium]
MLRTKADVDVAKDRLTETWETTREALAPRLAAARVAMTPYVDTAAARVSPMIDEARERITPAVERIGPAVERLGPAVDQAKVRLRDDVVPTVRTAAETAMVASAPARAEAKERAAAAMLALRGEKPQPVRRWPVALVCLLAGAAAGVVAGAMTRSSSPPTPPPTPFPRPQPAEADDAAHSSGPTGTSTLG